jgi:hypothetical protein
VARRRLPKHRESTCEADHVVELLSIPALAPDPVVDVLTPTGGVRAHRLDVPERVGADPDLLPGRRDDKLTDPLQHLVVVDPLSVLIEIFEAAASAAPCDPGP